MGSFKTSLFTVVLVVAAAAAAIRLAEAQPAQPSCANNLVPCFSYLNATTEPPASCCDPIKQSVANDLPCLCNLYRNPSFLTGLGINVQQALNLPRLCGIPSDVTACNATSPTSSHLPPGTPGTPRNDGVKIASAGIFSFLLIAAASMMLY